MLFAAGPFSLKSKRLRAPALRRDEAHTRHGLEDAACSRAVTYKNGGKTRLGHAWG